MGHIDWIPIADMPDALKDGRAMLLYGGFPDWLHSDEVLGDWEDGRRVLTWEKARPVSAWWDDEKWRYASYDGGYYGIYDDPTHFAEINPPASS